MKILFLCHGNICRSPMAEFILRQLVREREQAGALPVGAVTVESAAVSREEIGNPLYPPAQRCLARHGVPFDLSRRARQVTRADYDRFDRIICMDASNLRLLRRIIPGDPAGKVSLMMSWAGESRDVADPWYTGDFEAAYRDILSGCQALLDKDFTIRKATAGDLGAVNELLQQVLGVHHAGRPDLFNATGKKYTDAELLAIFADPQTPVFVYEQAGAVLGYAFCALCDVSSGSLKAHRTLYIDDLCVLESARGQHIGAALFDFVKAFARQAGCYNITLHVWACNPGARAFYERLGLQPQYTSMELICSEDSSGR